MGNRTGEPASRSILFTQAKHVWDCQHETPTVLLELCCLMTIVDAGLFSDLVYDCGAGITKATTAFLVFLASGLWVALRPGSRTSHKTAHEVLLDAALAYFAYFVVGHVATSEPGFIQSVSKWRQFIWVLIDGPANLKVCLGLVFFVARIAAWLVEEMAREAVGKYQRRQCKNS